MGKQQMAQRKIVAAVAAFAVTTILVSVSASLFMDAKTLVG
jgi:hypothetical protein